MLRLSQEEEKSDRKASQTEQKPIFHFSRENDPARIFDLEDEILIRKPGMKLLSTARRNPVERR